MKHNLKYQWNQLNILLKLVVVNLAVYILIVTIKLISFLFGSTFIINTIIQLFSLPAAPLKLLLKPWTIFTYMFVHENFWHIFGNLLWLYFMGLVALMYFSEKQFWRLYVLSGFAGALFFFLSYNIFPIFSLVKEDSHLLGASAAISGIVIAACAYKPNDNIYLFGLFKVPLWIIGALYVLYDLSMLPVDNNAGGHLAHLGGALYGLWFGLKLKEGKDITTWLSNIKLNIFKKRHKARMRVIKNEFRPGDYEWNAKQQEIKKEFDRILEKIAKHGYNSLSRKEREFLKKHSKDYEGFSQ